MKIFAVVPINGGIVSNIVVGENKESVEEVIGSCIEITEKTGVAGIGWTWDGNTFFPPLEMI